MLFIYIFTKMKNKFLTFQNQICIYVDSLTGNIRTLALMNESNGSSWSNWFASSLKFDDNFLEDDEENEELLICEINWWRGSVEEEEIIESGSRGASCSSSASRPY